MKFLKLLSAAITLVLSSNINAALVERLGGLAYYDTDANLTWLTDARYSFTSGYDDDGLMNWADAMAWAAQLEINGVTGWRLPNTVDVGNDGETYTNIYQGVDFGYNITAPSELSNMYYNVLGNLSYYDINGTQQCGICLQNTGPFENLLRQYYWSATEYSTEGHPDDAWVFSFSGGVQGHNYQTSSLYNAWAVHDGDISAVPVPAAVWLFGSGLIGLVGLARRKKA